MLFAIFYLDFIILLLSLFVDIHCSRFPPSPPKHLILRPENIDKHVLPELISPPHNASIPLSPDQLQAHGTTTLAFIFGDSVIIAVDSMASVGSFVGSRTVRKALPLGSHCLATMAGGAADCAHWIRWTSSAVQVGSSSYLSVPFLYR